MGAKGDPPKSFGGKVWAKIMHIITNITFEPAYFLILFGANIDNATYNEMTIRKSCLNDFNFTEGTCENLLDGNHTEENDMVQDKVIH